MLRQIFDIPPLSDQPHFPALYPLRLILLSIPIYPLLNNWNHRHQHQKLPCLFHNSHPQSLQFTSLCSFNICNKISEISKFLPIELLHIIQQTFQHVLELRMLSSLLSIYNGDIPQILLWNMAGWFIPPLYFYYLMTYYTDESLLCSKYNQGIYDRRLFPGLNLYNMKAGCDSQNYRKKAIVFILRWG